MLLLELCEVSVIIQVGNILFLKGEKLARTTAGLIAAVSILEVAYGDKHYVSLCQLS